MEAVLFVGHGSKDAAGNEEVRQFVASLVDEVEAPIVETCFLEFEPPDVYSGLEACLSRGATRIVVIPIILFSAGHAKIHIPAALDEFKTKHPDVPVTYGRPVGIHELVLGILEARLDEVEQCEERREQELAVLLVGRGSSDPDANSDIYKMARLFWERSKAKWVEPAFMGVTFPSFDEGMERCLKLGARHVVVLPYFLFTGVLIKRMADYVQHWQTSRPDVRFTLAEYFGFHPLLKAVLKDRVREALADEVKMNCDTCQYRLAAMEHVGHHHHHHDHDHSHDHGHHHHGHGYHHHHNHHHHHHHDHEHHQTDGDQLTHQQTDHERHETDQDRHGAPQTRTEPTVRK
ncbi:sirohydrochlorin chelatase [Brevibacillus humidisoli]|uniref:sirohydrochlorin chelatase n=1 Tax=Brevibacillus humidisoli TaxID=2895522 RepID=UPI001E2A75BB|nr:sirohydrochlorin chelatase [Brevibacillus humidisoli]UFJ41473.1 sirohydrochlorin chelatase [Brevibacillus humidisoli]